MKANWGVFREALELKILKLNNIPIDRQFCPCGHKGREARGTQRNPEKILTRLDTGAKTGGRKPETGSVSLCLTVQNRERYQALRRRTQKVVQIPRTKWWHK
ncbi:hypothetical protein PoB_001703300 [Plakobranchus ocellatus]|uniref:Uncharacterized protein n=1 Tax=Plakobranchus ocellatus TaxID=259542 RepID=A0AAV3Z741_9GAST|nr:hypothetical protein PoB_001703300 [Plakobranchus ocellatus]